MTPAQRQSIERQIVTQIVADAIAAGLEVSVFRGGEFNPDRSTDASALIAAILADDEEAAIWLYTPGVEKQQGWIALTFGSEGHDCIYDYMNNPITQQAVTYAERLAEHFERMGDEADV